MIRAATAADAASVRTVMQAADRPYVARIGQPSGPMLDDPAQRIAAGQLWVLEQPGGIIGAPGSPR